MSTTYDIFQQWQTYYKVIENNYMFHKEIINWVKTFSDEKKIDSTRILELGCGDAHVLRTLSMDLDIVEYTGIDQSDHALSLAKVGIEGSIPHSFFHQGHLIDVMKQLVGEYDIIIAGYVLHHLTTAEKLATLATVRNLMAPTGYLVMYDVFLAEGETVEGYNQKTVNHYRKRWNNLSAEELDTITAHVQSADIPASHLEWVRLGTENGLEASNVHFLDQERFFGIMTFRH